MLDHIFLTVSDLERSIAFYEKILAVIGIENRLDYDGKDGPADHPDLKGFGANGRVFFWLRQGNAAPEAVHVGFVANSEEDVRAVYAAALEAGAKSRIAPGYLDYYDPRYYAAQIFDLDGYSIEFVFKSWQH